MPSTELHMPSTELHNAINRAWQQAKGRDDRPWAILLWMVAVLMAPEPKNWIFNPPPTMLVPFDEKKTRFPLF
jgi:hypothetical protein